MNILEQYALAEQVKFWTNTITLGLMRAAIVAACVKYIFESLI